MGKSFYIVTSVLQSIVYIIAFYYFVLGLFGLFKRKDVKQNNYYNRFAIIIAAHNEELVISKLIESLLKQNYPKEYYDIFVIADNCTDRTAKISRKYDVSVYERFNANKKGKGYALEWAFKKILKNSKYDAVAIFDADNLVDPNWIVEINYKLQNGYNAVQGYIDSKNPTDSWIASAYTVSFWTQNRLYQLARSNLRLSNQIGGTGFVIKTETLRKIGWESSCLTEDLEFSCKLILSGEKIGWAHDAVIYDEKPLTLTDSWRQRRRWMQGFSDVATRYFTKLLKKGLIERKWYVLDCALYIIQPFITSIIGIGLIINILPLTSKFGINIFSINYIFGDTIIKIIAFSQLLVIPLALKVDKNISKGMFLVLALYSSSIFIIPELIRGKEGFLVLVLINITNYALFIIGTYIFLGKQSVIFFLRFLLYGLFNLTWIPISIQGIIYKNKKEWAHTKHVRSIELCDV